ncbi:MAG: beta-N-acetylhexosaminidase [Clostridia bacterium]|nr:beta-N-acetylhexosaminidase [Clostridia bacterium]
MLPIIPKVNYEKVLSDKLFNYTLSDVVEVQDDTVKKSGYKLIIDESGVKVCAKDSDGFYYGKVTIENLLDVMGALPHCVVEDYPRYAYRGYMLDCARHFFPVETVKRMIDIMPKFKLNVFHWHLTEDQGWRIQIDKYPLLTEIGSYRNETRGDGKPIKGYYTKEEMREVVAYAKERHVEVMPEFDIPGHTAAAIAAYPFLDCNDSKITVKESFGIHPEVLCAGKESSYEFVTDVLKEIFEIFPYNLIHLGGDEALRLHWLDCEACQKVMKDNNLKDEDELQAHFMARIVEFCKGYGKTVVNWNDGMVGENVHEDVIVHYWQGAEVNRNAAVREINRGKKGIISPFFNFYLDYPYGLTSLKKCFSCNPEIDGVTATENIMGVEGPLWAEYVKNQKDIDRQTFPRLIAIAERGWSEWHEDYKGFRARLKYNYKIIDKLGIECDRIEKVDPNPISKVISLIKFFGNAWDKTQLQNAKNVAENKRRLNEKYGK